MEMKAIFKIGRKKYHTILKATEEIIVTVEIITCLLLSKGDGLDVQISVEFYMLSFCDHFAHNIH